MRWLFLMVTSCTALACGSEETGAGGAGEGGSSPQGAGGGSTWGDGACGTCVRDACATQIDACLADPECPSYLDCLDACPATEAGDADPACQASCPRGSGTESLRAVAAIDACRDPGAGADCAACGIADRTAVPDFSELNQSCGPSSDPTVCGACQDQSCCDSLAACAAEPACVAYKDCVRGGGAAELYECALAHRQGIAVAAPGYVCAEYHCAVGTDMTGQCDPSARDACFTCMFDVCGKEWAALYRTENGFLASWCGSACDGDTACSQACLDLYPGSEAASLQLAECLLAGCDGIC